MSGSIPQIHKGRIITSETGEALGLRGVNLGGWLFMEGYILGAPNFPEREFKRKFKEALGQDALQEFEEAFYGHFIQEEDLADISRKGFNCVRVPFHYRLMKNDPDSSSSDRVKWLDKVFDWAEKHHLWVILDLHAASGAQNHQWHSDSLGRAELWENEARRQETIELWEFLSDRYKDKSCLAGYDLLNESVVEDEALLNQFYGRIIKAIRAIDKNHLLFIEGNHFATDLRCLDRFDDANYVLSFHTYEPLDFTFNYIPHLHYPCESEKFKSNKAIMKIHLEQYRLLAEQRGVPILVGEFGVNTREGLYGEDRWLKDNLDLFNEFGFHWTYWTYKAIKCPVFPDGLYSLKKNPPWVNRMGPETGWDTYRTLWSKQKNEIKKAWQTSEFEENTYITDILRDHL